MDILTYILSLGILGGIYFAQGIFFTSTHQQNAPYRHVFGIFMLWAGFIVLAEAYIIIHNIENLVYYYDTLVFLDASDIPFLFLELQCIVDQDLKKKPLSRRWTKMILLEIPIISATIYSLKYWEKDLLIISLIVFFTYMALVLIYSPLKLIRYERLLKNIKGKNRRSIKWVWKIITLYIILTATYFIESSSPYMAIIPLFVDCVIALFHGYYIYRQQPVDTTKMESIASAMTEEGRKTFAEIEELKKETNSMQKRLNMDMYIRAFNIQHPDFENRLRQRAVHKLTKRDIYLCILIFEGKKMGELAKELGISASSAEMARSRLRSKLNLDKKENLRNVITNIKDAPSPSQEDSSHLEA